MIHGDVILIPILFTAISLLIFLMCCAIFLFTRNRDVQKGNFSYDPSTVRLINSTSQEKYSGIVQLDQVGNATDSNSQTRPVVIRGSSRSKSQEDERCIEIGTFPGTSWEEHQPKVLH